MTIQINITQKEMYQKFHVCEKLINLLEIGTDVKQSEFRHKLSFIEEKIYHDGNLEEIYQNLHHIETMLLEKNEQSLCQNY